MNLLYVVTSYDIVEDRIRTKAAKVCEDFGQRVQKSVFDCRVTEQNRIDLRTKLRDLIDPTTDSVRFYQLCRVCQNAIDILGGGTVIAEDDLIIL